MFRSAWWRASGGGPDARAEGALGALEAWGEWPRASLCVADGPGPLLLCGWRALQSLVRRRSQGDKPKALANRLGQRQRPDSTAGCRLGVRPAGPIEDLHEGDDQPNPESSPICDLATRQALVLGLGVVILAAGIATPCGLLRPLRRDLDCDARTAAWAGTWPASATWGGPGDVPAAPSCSPLAGTPTPRSQKPGGVLQTFPGNLSATPC